MVFRRAHITDFLDLRGARLSNPAGRALFAPELIIDGDLLFRDGSVAGEINIIDGHVAGLLDLSGARLENPGNIAVCASRLTVGGPMIGRDGFTVNGDVVLRRARIAGFLDLCGARLSNPAGYALVAPGLAAEGGVVFRDGSVFDGQVSLEDAHITGDLDLTEARFTGHQGGALAFAHLSARQLKMPRTPVTGAVDLSHMRVGVLSAHPDSTPDGIRVSELVYDTLSPLLPPGERVRWLTTIDEGYLPQPYEQLAAVYRRLGHDSDARSVLLAKQRRRHRTLPLPARLWGLLQDVTTGYGYRPGRAGLWLIGLVAAGTAIFGFHHPAPVNATGNAQFNPFFYTLDLLLPIFSYGQQSAFQPAGAYQWLSYGLITAGWILATTIITGTSRALYRG